MSTVNMIYATDEDIALRASADFSILCPRDQKLAWGIDGAFLSSDPWTLASGSVNFLSHGLVPGQLVLLTKPTSAFRPPGELLVIATVTAGGLGLRRKGQAPGVGQPPGSSTDLTGIEFSVNTLGPQIELASYDLNRRYGIDDFLLGRRSSDLYDPKEVRDATVLTVLHRQYLDMSKSAEGQLDMFATKSRVIKDELDELLARVVVHWKPSNPIGDPSAPTTRFSTRISR
jgi:hypothetical protein